MQTNLNHPNSNSKLVKNYSNLSKESAFSEISKITLHPFKKFAELELQKDGPGYGFDITNDRQRNCQILRVGDGT